MAKRWHLIFNDRTQTIQGYHIDNSYIYRNVKAAVLDPGFRKWHPNYIDIKLLESSYYTTNPIVSMLMPAFLSETKRSRRKTLRN